MSAIAIDDGRVLVVDDTARLQLLLAPLKLLLVRAQAIDPSLAAVSSLDMEMIDKVTNCTVQTRGVMIQRVPVIRRLMLVLDGCSRAAICRILDLCFHNQPFGSEIPSS
jgi:hypothetical protein